jgi:hypothetical protein
MLASTPFQVEDSLQNNPKIVEFDKSIIQSYQENDDYNYFKTIEEESAWQKFKNWLNLQWNKFLEWLLSDISEGQFWNYLALILKILLILGIVVLIAWLFNKYYISNPKPSPANQNKIHLSEEERLIQEKDLSVLIEEAETQENYRLATRYWFLNILKNLKEQGLIEYQFQKTNADYKSEIIPQNIKTEFSYLSRFYEFVWYGDFELQPAEFKKAKSRYKQLTNNIQNTKANG